MILRAIIFFTFLFPAFSLSAQSLPLRFQGNVSEERVRMSGVNLQISKSGRVMNNILTDANGNYSFELPMGGEFMVIVSKEGYVSKKFSVSTMGVPPEKATSKFPIIEASLTLFKRMEGIDYSLLNQPLNKYYYNVDQDNFEYDENHLRQMLKGLEQIKEQEKALKNNEKEKEAAYLSAVKNGDKAFQKKEWQAALGAYKEASGIKPSEAYPTAQIARINDNIAAENAKKASEAEALAKKQAEEQAAKKAAEAAAAAALAKKAADEAAAKKAADEAAARAQSEKLAREKAEADAIAKKKAEDEAAAKALAEKQSKEKAEADALAKKKADEASAKALVEKQNKEKAEAEALAKKQAEEASAKKAAETAAAAALAKKLADEAAAKEQSEKLNKEKAEALAKKQKEEEAAKKAAEAAAIAAAAKKAADDAAAKALAEKQAKEKLEADAKKTSEPNVVKTTSDKTVLPVLGASQVNPNYTNAIKKADEAFSKHRYYDAKQAYEEALVAKGGDVYAKTRLLECEKHINADANQKVDEKQKQLLAKYPQGVTEEIVTAESVLIIRRVLVKDNKAFVYEKKVFNWGGIACFRDGESITELTFEQETRKDK